VHVAQRGVNKADIFADDKDRNLYLDYLVEASDKHDCPIHCYVLMKNHVHLLTTPAERNALPKTMHSLNHRYAAKFNRLHERTGPLFEGRYFDKPVKTDRYLKIVYQYIELNPVRAGLCKKPADFRWSSHGFHAHGHSDRIVTVHACYTSLGDSPQDRQKKYRRWFRDALNEEQLLQIRSGRSLAFDKPRGA
jgi:putative transposase